MSIQYDVIIVGAGAAGMMSAIEAGKRGRKVLLVDHYKKIGEKIRISGGGDVILLILTLILINFFHKTLSS
jgi:predicted flavoprotein YhiN